jgi:hypothetical protein
MKPPSSAPLEQIVAIGGKDDQGVGDAPGADSVCRSDITDADDS